MGEDTTQGTWAEHGKLDFLPPDLVQLFAAAYAGGNRLSDLRAPAVRLAVSLPRCFAPACGGVCVPGHSRAFFLTAWTLCKQRDQNTKNFASIFFSYFFFLFLFLNIYF